MKGEKYFSYAALIGYSTEYIAYITNHEHDKRGRPSNNQKSCKLANSVITVTKVSVLCYSIILFLH